jgi:hypothetical protein
MSGVEISSTRLDSHGQRLTLLEKAATKSSGVPAAASGGTTGSGSDLSIDEGGGPARAGALHLSSDTGPGGGGTTLAQGAGDRAVAAAWVAQTAAAALATAAAGSAGSAPMTKGRGSRRLTSQPTMASLIPYRGSTSVAPTFEA